ncbi:Hypothetical protein FNO222_1234 [Francisella orientalis]|uniref:Uncharacterized protein n=1 Tax=Francisella orientalis TaxID=299583 RepID=A0ABN4H4Q5_9GAMM|nr:hypothetical protein FNO12_1223 [Francisella orientalis FNO12]AKN87355.1 Hypothetical protein FNO24_1225 [Francisella orientalis FNO24]AKN88892.1 Hypothetical protein FNO190_1223 [Francisella orientalis]AKU05651.1 Hypothetical protein FNO01_1223 [Francisella orientalis]QEN20565.1 Hypothetical protein FNO39_1234 [Francisella orientalis]
MFLQNQNIVKSLILGYKNLINIAVLCMVNNDWEKNISLF